MKTKREIAEAALTARGAEEVLRLLEERENAVIELTAAWTLAVYRAFGRSFPPWISVGDRLPIDGERVLAATRERVFTATYHMGWPASCGVTHWMPPPNPPS